MESFARALGTLLEWILIALMVALTAIVVIAVLFRKLDASLSWYDEVASILLAWITYYGGALAALRRKHIGFDGVLLAIPMPARMVAVWSAEIVFLAFFVLLAWAGWTVLVVLQGDTLISLTWMPVQVTQSVIPIGAVLFIVCELLSLPAYLAMIRSGVSAEHAEIEAEISAETTLTERRQAEARMAEARREEARLAAAQPVAVAHSVEAAADGAANASDGTHVADGSAAAGTDASDGTSEAGGASGSDGKGSPRS